MEKNQTPHYSNLQSLNSAIDCKGNLILECFSPWHFSRSVENSDLAHFFKHLIHHWFILRLHAQNGICSWDKYFWPKNYDEEWSRKNIFRISLWASHFLINVFTYYYLEIRIFAQSYKFSKINDLIYKWRDFKKNLCIACRYNKWKFKPGISPIFHFENINKIWTSGILGVKLRPKWKNSEIKPPLTQILDHNEDQKMCNDWISKVFWAEIVQLGLRVKALRFLFFVWV